VVLAAGEPTTTESLGVAAEAAEAAEAAAEAAEAAEAALDVEAAAEATKVRRDSQYRGASTPSWFKRLTGESVG